MSGLKDYSILDIEAIDDERLKAESAPGKWVPESRVYLKSEADAVIANLEESHKKEVGELLMEIAKLKDAQRWRKYPEEKPSEDTRYIICGSSGFRDADRWMYLKEKQRMGFGFHDYGVKYWMPMPKAPENDDCDKIYSLHDFISYEDFEKALRKSTTPEEAEK